MIEALLGPNLTVATTDIPFTIPSYLNESNYKSILELVYKSGFSYEKVVQLIERLKQPKEDSINFSVDLYTTSQTNMSNRARTKEEGSKVWQDEVNHAFKLVVGDMPSRGRLLFEAIAQTSHKVTFISGEGGVKNNNWVFAEEINPNNKVYLADDPNRLGFAVANMQDLATNLESQQQYGAVVILACNPSQQKLQAHRVPIFYCQGAVGNFSNYSKLTAFPKT